VNLQENSDMSQDYIIVAALSMETTGLEQFAPIIHTGVGKINASIKLYEALLTYQPSQVINYGTAGAVNGHTGLLKVDTFIQHDMDVRALGVEKGITPFSTEQLPAAKGIVLATGDCFITNSRTQLAGLNIEVDLIDMEAYALHKVCEHHHIAFDCYKYVSDNTDKNASTDWVENVANGTQQFAQLLEQHYGQSTLK
jgi:adenosylhomocysteine nucleosidase